MKFSIIIPATRPHSIPAVIDSICAQSYPDWELVVVGQAEDANLRDVVKASAKKDGRIRYLHINQRGTSRARNAGAQCTVGEIIAFIDDDCEARSDWLETFVHFFDTHPDIGLVGGAVIPPQKLKPGFGVYFGLYPSEGIYDPIESPHSPPQGWDWTGGNFAIRREIFQNTGPFDICLGPGTFFLAGEDVDYKLRLESDGVKMAATPHAVVYHTYGSRHGLKAVMKNTRNYTYGTYGLAGKLTLMGDSRGSEWLMITRKHCLSNWLRTLRFYRLPIDLYRLWNSTLAYIHCLRNYRVISNLLYKK